MQTLPQITDKLFKGKFADRQVATINWMKGLNNDYNFGFLISGYKLAYETLIEQAIQISDEEIIEKDYLINPILYCLRHFIELICKDTIRKFNMAFQKTNTDEIGFEQTHDNSVLFKKIVDIFEKYKPEYTLEIRTDNFKTELLATSQIIDELNSYDQYSFSFRYLYKRANDLNDKIKETITETSVDLNNLKAIAEKLVFMLSCLNSEASAFRSAEKTRIDYGIIV